MFRGSGPGRKKVFAALVVPWCLLVLGGMDGVTGVYDPIPDCTYPVYQDDPLKLNCLNNCANDRLTSPCGIRQAFDAYMSSGTTGNYGPIEEWDTSLVTDMSFAFLYTCLTNQDGECMAGRDGSVFNEDISAWDVGKVTSMFASTYTLLLPL